MSRPDSAVPSTGWALAAAVTALLFGVVFFGGGSSGESVPELGSAALLVAAAAVVAGAFGALRLPVLDRPGRLTLAAAGALTAWVGVSIVWSIAGDRSWAALSKGLVYLAFLVLGIVLASATGALAARTAAASLALVVAVAVAWALLGRAVPGLFPDGGRIARLREPVDYWNALALVAGTALPLGLWLVGATAPRLRRVAGALLVYGAVLTILLTQSRAGLLAAVAGVAVWLVLSRVALQAGLIGACAAVPALVVAGWTFTRPALVSDGALRTERVSDGALFALLACVGALVAAVLADRVPAERLVAADPARMRRRLVLAAVAAVAAGAVALVAAVGNPLSWAGDQVSGGECVNDPGRLTELCANNRVEWWGQALEVARDRPLGGSGALTFEIARKRIRDNGTPVLQPHSVPLQLLSDLGVVGLALGGTLVVAAGIGIRRGVRRLDGAEREAAAALACVPVVYGVHALVDYDLDFMAVTAPALVACGALLGVARPAARVGSPVLTTFGAVAAGVAAVVVVVTPSLAEREVDRSTGALDRGRLAAAATAATRARSLDPLSLDPVWAAAAVADRRGNTDLARALYRRATRMQPENPEAWIALGLYELTARQDLCATYHALNTAYTLDPSGRQWVPGGPLDVARDAVNAGACES